MKKIICVVGPTASGKTGLAVRLAKKFNGEIISADSRQIYRGLDIGTGKDLAEYGDIKCHLIDICNPEEDFNMFAWLELAKKSVEDILGRGKLPIIAGGTGLYVQAFVEGFTLTKNEKRKTKNHNVKLTNYSRDELEKSSLEKLRIILQKLDENVFGKIDQKNPHRLIRAIERAQEGTKVTKNPPNYEFLQLGINLPREILYKKIDMRVDSRFREGMLDEIARLLQSGVDQKWLEKLGLEYRTICKYLISNKRLKIKNQNAVCGRNANLILNAKCKKFFQTEKILISNDQIFSSCEFEKMAQELKYKIHAYARRQLTWFRRFPKIVWVENKQQAETLVENFLCK